MFQDFALIRYIFNSIYDAITWLNLEKSRQTLILNTIRTVAHIIDVRQFHGVHMVLLSMRSLPGLT